LDVHGFELHKGVTSLGPYADVGVSEGFGRGVDGTISSLHGPRAGFLINASLRFQILYSVIAGAQVIQCVPEQGYVLSTTLLAFFVSQWCSHRRSSRPAAPSQVWFAPAYSIYDGVLQKQVLLS
jgi:hypothetical protein